MTEAEWFATADVGKVLKWLSFTRQVRRPSVRSLQLFAVACACRVPELADDPAFAKVLRAATEAAERGAPADAAAERARLRTATPDGWRWQMLHALLSVCDSTAWQFRLPEAHAQTVTAYAQLRIGAGEAERQMALLREVLGNPFRPVAFSPEWRTDTAVALARQMYEEREFGAMPILADALQDAGCDSDDVLAHCRDTAHAHVRGCWVCDLVLGKA